MNVDLDMGNNKIINITPGSDNNDAVNYQQLTTKANENETLLLDGSNKMAADLDRSNNKIINLSTDSHNVLSATNIRYVNQVNGAMIITLTDSFTKKINDSHISDSTNKKSVFQYLMDDVNQSTRESNIIVDGIEDFSDSPHDISKKAYSFRIGKDAQNWYAFRLGFNMYLLPEGEFTLVIEFFPPAMDQVTVSVVFPPH